MRVKLAVLLLTTYHLYPVLQVQPYLYLSLVF